MGPIAMNRRLAEAVIATFGEEDRATHLRRLDALLPRDWRRELRWLDASGLALYFRQRLKTLDIEESISHDILQGLDKRCADNYQRTAELFREFEAINIAFQQTGLHYVNLKGFTLVPDYCPDPSLRCQLDLDFMILESELPSCHEILRNFGYSMTARHKNVVEFKAGSEQLPSIRDLYKPRSQKSVEVHIFPAIHVVAGGVEDGRWQPQDRMLNGVAFPALSHVEMFVAQSKHLFCHLKSEWTRLSWLLEFRTFLNKRSGDARFWREVHNQLEADKEAALTVGISVLLATEVFGEAGPPNLLAWSRNTVPCSVRLWLDRFGKKALLSDFPGTKLYLLLERELSDCGNTHRTRWAKLIPLHRTPQVTCPGGRGPFVRFHASLSQTWFTLFRMRFHIVEGWNYWIAARQWKRFRPCRQRTSASQQASELLPGDIVR